MLGLKLNHVSKRGPCLPSQTSLDLTSVKFNSKYINLVGKENVIYEFWPFFLGPNQVCKGGWFEMFWLVYIFSTLWAEQKAIPAWWVLGNQHLGTISRWICYFWHMYVSDLESWSLWNNKHIFKKHMFLFGFKMESARSLYIYTHIFQCWLNEMPQKMIGWKLSNSDTFIQQILLLSVFSPNYSSNKR